ncbi:unnamed protein product [Caenorhabditis angaria]|uniref:Uncharacterized protein n=1 Tax=Caenorhabditis angaria TaxID=860376 RepID=A0A9P1IRZ0_9PELO|nr:unnamed protein product [Caenorhabditis angaria]
MDDQELEYEQLERYDEPDDETDSVYQGNVEDSKIEKKEKIATEKAFGINPTSGQHLKVTSKEGAALRKELGAEIGKHVIRAALVHGVDGMHDYQITKVFAAFRASNTTKLDESQAIVQFILRQDVAAMMLNMTKMMKRVRGRKLADEDGEISSDDEYEEGQIMHEKGDDVEIVDNLQTKGDGIIKKDKDYVTVDVSNRQIPDGKWRVVTQHVPAGKFLLVRFPTNEEYELAGITVDDSEEQQTRKRQIAESEFWTHETKHRGGLNMFDKDGNELDWDYEHDTRFYDEKVEEEKRKSDAQSKFELPKGIKVRGRGAVKCGFLFGSSSSNSESTLASDDQREVKRKRQNSEDKDVYEKDDVLSRVKTTGIDERISFR